MSGLREVIAVFSAVCAVTLLILAARSGYHYRTPKKSRFIALCIYGSLFAFTAAVLWTRQPSRILRDKSEKTAGIDRQIPSSEDSSVAGNSSAAETLRKIGASLSADDNVVFNPLKKDVASVQKTRSRTELSDSGNQRDLNAVDQLESNRDIAQTWDERAYDAVSQVFDAVEQWFWRHGSPSTQQTGDRMQSAVVTRHTVLPDIVFIENTAEMTTESARRLRLFAKDLKNRPQMGEIEIQAQTDGNGPIPFQFILTQARAEVVRDFLSKEGVLNYRLIASAINTDSRDSTTAKSQIRFVFRP